MNNEILYKRKQIHNAIYIYIYLFIMCKYIATTIKQCSRFIYVVCMLFSFMSFTINVRHKTGSCKSAIMIEVKFTFYFTFISV